MKALKMVDSFNDAYPRVGPIFWMISVQYFIIQIIVASVWSKPYSLSKNTISDLGNTACAVYGKNFVCSPLHSLMNVSFIILGCTMIAGEVLIYREFRKGKAAIFGFIFMAFAGGGTILVGSFPENTVSALHIIGAALPFFVGNIGEVILGISLDIPIKLRIYTIFSGLFALSALGLFISHNYLGLGIGGMERLTAYPQTIWLIVFGIYMSRSHYTQLLKHNSAS
jgi:hypothetical membrane protein